MVSCRRVCGCCNARRGVIAVAITGVLMVVIGLAAQPMIHAVMRSQLRDQVTMEGPDAQLFDIWSGKQSIPEYMSYFVFNVTNPDAITKGAKPALDLIGPFTYREVNVKSNISWSPDGHRVNFTYTRIFYLVDERCAGPVVNTDEPPTCTLDDGMELTMGNAPLMGFIWQLMTAIPDPTEIELDAIGLAIQFVVDKINKNHPNPTDKEPFFITKPVREVIWGYNDTILGNVYALVEEIRHLLPKRAANLTAQDPFIGYQVNNSQQIHTRTSAINTGKNDPLGAFQYEEWAGNEGHLSIWKGCDTRDALGVQYNKEGNMINGTDGLQFRALLDDDTLLDVYSQDLLRSAVLYPTIPVTIKDIDLKRYKIMLHTLQNSTMYAPNCAFDDYGPSGVMNMTRAYSAPVFASKPMFLDADPDYRSWVDGLFPAEPIKHDTFLDIEPWTGACMHAHQRLQVNLRHAYNPYVYSMVNFPKTGFYLPVFWADEWAYISDDLADDWKSQVGLALKVGKDTQTVGMSVGLGFLGIALALAVVMALRGTHRATDEAAPLLKSVNSDY